jgi:hypothetical protein
MKAVRVRIAIDRKPEIAARRGPPYCAVTEPERIRFPGEKVGVPAGYNSHRPAPLRTGRPWKPLALLQLGAYLTDGYCATIKLGRMLRPVRFPDRHFYRVVTVSALRALRRLAGSIFGSGEAAGGDALRAADAPLFARCGEPPRFPWSGPQPLRASFVARAPFERVTLILYASIARCFSIGSRSAPVWHRTM